MALTIQQNLENGDEIHREKGNLYQQIEEHKTPEKAYNPNTSYRVIENSANDTTDFLTSLHTLRLKNVNRIIIAHININSIRNKFHLLTNDIRDKIDESFSKNEFLIPGFTEPYRADRNCHGGGILLYVRSDIPSKEVTNCGLSSPSERFFVEINLRKKKWLICCSYIPNKNLIQNHLHEISKKT